MGDKYRVTSHNQQGGITAGQVNFGKPLRKLEDSLKRELDEALTDHAHKEVVIMASQTEDCFQFGRQVKEHLESKGFTVGDVGAAMIFNREPNTINCDRKGPAIIIQIT